MKLKSLVEIRTRHEITQAEIAEAMKTSAPSVSAVERGDRPCTDGFRLRYREALINVLGDRLEAARALNDVLTKAIEEVRS